MLHSALWHTFRPSIRLVTLNGNTPLKLTPAKYRVLLYQYREWFHQYLPETFTVEGATILDVGAGCGETAYFYFNQGVKKVFAIECNIIERYCLRKNADKAKWNLEIIGRAFKLSHLKTQFNLCKMDIEGGEDALLKLDRIDFPLIVESHSDETTSILQNRFGLHLKTETNSGHKILTNC